MKLKPIMMAGMMLLTFVLGEISLAGDALNVYVIQVRVEQEDRGLVQFSSDVSGSPGCMSGHPSHHSFDLSTPAGQGFLSLMLTAMAANKKVHSYGTNECNEWTVIESSNWAKVVD